MSNDAILKKLHKNMILFGKVCVPNMFSVDSPPFHYEVAESLMDKECKQVNIIAPSEQAYKRASERAEGRIWQIE